MDREKERHIFENLPVKQAVIKQVMPAVFSQMIALAYNLADTYFVGMLDDSLQTAAITVAASSFLMLTALSNLFGIGGGVLVARFLGQNNSEAAKRIPAISCWIGLGAACMCSALYAMMREPILHICGATAETYTYAENYVFWTVILGGPFVVMNALLANLIRAEGNALMASMGISIGGILNIVLDPIFVLPMFMGKGVVGAAMATAVSNATGTLFFLLFLLIRKNSTIVNISFINLQYTKLYIGKILSAGFPSALQYGLTVVAVAAQSGFISKYSAQAVAGLGIVKKLDNLPLYFSIGTANGLLPLLAYNNAAGNEMRRRQAFSFGCMLSVGFSLLCFMLYEVEAELLASIFIGDPITVEYAAAFLRRMVTAMPFMAFTYPMIVQFQAMGKIKESLIISVLRKGVIDIPLLFLMDHLIPLYGCLWVQPIVDALSLLVSLMLYQRLDRKL